ncbi:MAG: YlxR family protein [Clostridiales bacterium]|nr:YlxR family protein [Clostridiales bacterium]
MNNRTPAYTPQRTCIACRKKADKREFLRIVCDTSGNVFVDGDGKADGRGCYVCRTAACLARVAQKRMLSRVFKREVPLSVYEALPL